MVDITEKWNLIVQACQKEYRQGNNSKNNKQATHKNSFVSKNNKILEKDPFLKKCFDVYQNAIEIEKFFVKMKAKYLNVTQHLARETETSASSIETLNETQCNELEHEMSLCIAQLTRLLQQLTTTLGEMMARAGVDPESHKITNKWDREEENGDDERSLRREMQLKDVWTHRMGVVAHLQYTIRTITEHFTRLRQQRLAMLLQRHTFTLGSYGELSKSLSQKPLSKFQSSSGSSVLHSYTGKSEFFSTTDSVQRETTSTTHVNSSSTLTRHHTGKDTGVDLQLESDLQQQLLRENALLQHQLDTLVDQIRDVEREVIAISQAQQILSENVAKQHEDIETLSRAVQKAHTHVKRGNEQLQRATKTSVHCRFYVLLFLLSLSFTLLLMHWYN